MFVCELWGSMWRRRDETLKWASAGSCAPLYFRREPRKILVQCGHGKGDLRRSTRKCREPSRRSLVVFSRLLSNTSRVFRKNLSSLRRTTPLNLPCTWNLLQNKLFKATSPQWENCEILPEEKGNQRVRWRASRCAQFVLILLNSAQTVMIDSQPIAARKTE